jgi:hypothetical protein
VVSVGEWNSLSRLIRGVGWWWACGDDVSLSPLVASSVYKLVEGDDGCGDEPGLVLFVGVGTLPASASSEACQ